MHVTQKALYKTQYPQYIADWINDLIKDGYMIRSMASTQSGENIHMMHVVLIVEKVVVNKSFSVHAPIGGWPPNRDTGSISD